MPFYTIRHNLGLDAYVKRLVEKRYVHSYRSGGMSTDFAPPFYADGQSLFWYNFGVDGPCHFIPSDTKAYVKRQGITPLMGPQVIPILYQPMPKVYKSRLSAIPRVDIPLDPVGEFLGSNKTE